MNTRTHTFEDRRSMTEKTTPHRWAHRITAALLLAGTAAVAHAGPYAYIPAPNPDDWAENTDTTVNVPGMGSVTMRWRSPDATASYKPDSNTFPGSPYNNPAWVVGNRDLFATAYDDAPAPKTSYTLTFATGLPTTGYLVFADFENGEAVSIKAYDSSNNLIPYSAFLFEQWDGGATGGATVSYLTYSTGTNLPASGYSFQVVAADLEDGSYTYDDYLAWTLGSSTSIYKLELEFVHTYGSARFNVAAPSANVPVPGTLALMALGLAGIGWGRRRRAGTGA